MLPCGNVLYDIVLKTSEALLQDPADRRLSTSDALASVPSWLQAVDDDIRVHLPKVSDRVLFADILHADGVDATGQDYYSL